MKKKEVWVVIAAYNEEKHIRSVVKKTKKYLSNIVVVDDGSKDKTYEAAKAPGVTVLKHIVNLGKGGAMKTGCEYAFSQGAKATIMIDADGQHEPSEIPRFLKQLEKHAIVFGYRKQKKSMPLVFRFGNGFLNLTIKVLYGMDLKDTQCGYRAFTKKAYKTIRWRSTGYSVESEMIANAGSAKLSYVEIPIQTIYGDKYKGTNVLDGIKIALNMLIWRLTRWS